MTPKTSETASAPAPSVSVDLAALKALLHDTVAEATAPLQAELATLKERLDATERMTPKYSAVKVKNPGGDYRQTLADMVAGDQKDGVKGRVPVMANGKPLPNGVFAMLHPSFDNGDLVRVNPEVERVEATNGKPAKTWGDICTRAGCDGTGYIVKKLDVLTAKGWLYQVHLDGIHAGDRFQGIPEAELLAVS